MKGIFLASMSTPNLVVISLGGNKGDVLLAFENAKKQISFWAETDNESSVYETEPWGKANQNWFLNQIIGLRVFDLSAEQIMKKLLEIEMLEGRDRAMEERWGDRTLDLDLLFYQNQIVEQKEVTVPHPRMHLRRFILEPLNEIYPNWVHPVLNKSVSQLLKDCSDNTLVRAHAL